MKVVLDANVWLSGIPRLREQNSPPRKLIAAWLEGEFDLVISGHILEEVSRNFQKPYFKALLQERDTASVFDEIRRFAEIVELGTSDQMPKLATHPEDDYVLATAVVGRVDFLVTGDKQLQKIAFISDIAIVSPAQMLIVIETQRER